MPIFSFRAFSAQNLLNGAGDQPFNVSSTNPPGNVPGTYTTGSDTGFTLRIDDTGTGGATGTVPNFDDGTSAAQVLAEDATFTYALGNGNVVTTTFPAGSQIQAELQQSFSNGATIVALRIENPGPGPNLLTVGYTFIGPPPPPGTVLGTYTGGTGAGVTPYTNLVCFTAGIEIETSNGPCRIEDIRIGDLVLTHDNGPQPVTWIGKTVVSAFELMRFAQWRPVVVPQGVLGAQRDLQFSRNHCALLRGPDVELIKGSSEVLAAVGHLDGLVHLAPVAGPVTYYHIACDDHQLITAEGMLVETLLAIPESTDALAAEGQDAGDRRAIRPILKKWEVALILKERRKQGIEAA